MRFVTMMFAVGALALGIYYGASSLTAKIITGEQAATLSCACFLFAITLGVWKDSDDHTRKQINQRLDDLRKIEAQHLQAYYDNNPSRGQYRQEQSLTGQYQRPPNN